jgi:hypothetical protein
MPDGSARLIPFRRIPREHEAKEKAHQRAGGSKCIPVPRCELEGINLRERYADGARITVERLEVGDAKKASFPYLNPV